MGLGLKKQLKYHIEEIRLNSSSCKGKLNIADFNLTQVNNANVLVPKYSYRLGEGGSTERIETRTREKMVRLMLQLCPGLCTFGAEF